MGSRLRMKFCSALPAKERDAIFPQLTFVELPTHDVLHEPGEPIKFGYFLNSGMTSILTVLAEGKSVEVGLTGKDGFVGLAPARGIQQRPDPGRNADRRRRLQNRCP